MMRGPEKAKGSWTALDLVRSGRREFKIQYLWNISQGASQGTGKKKCRGTWKGLDFRPRKIYDFSITG
jgi:predicted dithiol-disulfide oxidoreductase (DUF899 family)